MHTLPHVEGIMTKAQVKPHSNYLYTFNFKIAVTKPQNTATHISITEIHENIT